MVASLKILVTFRELLYAWMQREIKIRYKQSFIGGLWAIIQPFSLMIILSLIFSVFARIPTDGVPYPIFYYSALLPWVLFTNAISYAVPSLVNNINLVTKIYFPREILPLAGVGAALFDFVIASTIYILMIVYYRVEISPAVIWLPLLLIIQILFTLGIVLFLSSAMVFYRDVRFVIPLLTQLWMFATPIIYPLSSVPEKYIRLYMLNPMAVLINGYRQVILFGETPEWSYLLIAAGIALLSFLVGYLYFKKSEGTFADLI